MRRRAGSLSCFLLLLVVLLITSPLTPLWGWQQDKAKPRDKQQAEPLTEGLPKRKPSEKERKRREERLRKELEGPYKKWLEEDVIYIISDEEKQALLHLNTEEEREQFIEQFWLRRDPTPDTIENEYKEEHYYRIAYANEKFSVGRPGWMTDRGRIYIIQGPADQIESHSAGSAYTPAPSEGDTRLVAAVYPFERWRYRYIEGIGTEINIEFVDRNGDGDYKLMPDPTEKEIFTSIGPLTRGEDPLLQPGYGELVRGEMSRHDRMERFLLYSLVQRPPEVKFKDLEALVQTRISFNLLPFDLRTDFFRITGETTLTPITIAIQKKSLSFQMKEGLHHATVNIFGRVSTLTGRIIDTFEDVIELQVPPALLERTLEEAPLYQKSLLLRPGLYKLNLVVKDLNSGNLGTLERRLPVPRFEEDQLAHSSLILADLIEQVPARNLGGGQFVIGDARVRPSIDRRFRRGQRLGIFLQVYNLALPEGTGRPEATIDYVVVQGNQSVFTHRESTTEMRGAGSQLTLTKYLPLQPFPPGSYRLKISVTDEIRGDTFTTSTLFEVRP